MASRYLASPTISVSSGLPWKGSIGTPLASWFMQLDTESSTKRVSCITRFLTTLRSFTRA